VKTEVLSTADGVPHRRCAIRNGVNTRFWCVALGSSLAVSLAVGQSLPARATVQAKNLQGSREGEGAGGKCSIKIDGNSLLYRAGTNWHQTTFTLPAGTGPQQLHATIKDSWPPVKESVGTVVHVIIKLEGETLPLVSFDESKEPPKDFEDGGTSKYVVKKSTGQGENWKKPGA
jgi:hypothetical protein